MKKIKNEKTIILESKVKFKGDEKKHMSYKDLIELVLDIVPQGGFTVTDVTNRLRLKDQLKKAKDDISLEDADYGNLKELIKISRWPYYDEEIGTFLKQFS